MTKLDKDKIEMALIRAGQSNKRSKRLAEILAKQDLLKEEQESTRKTRTVNVKEVKKDNKEE